MQKIHFQYIYCILSLEFLLEPNIKLIKRKKTIIKAVNFYEKIST